MAMLNREWEGYSITVLPTAGAVASVRGYTLGFDGWGDLAGAMVFTGPAL